MHKGQKQQRKWPNHVAHLVLEPWHWYQNIAGGRGKPCKSNSFAHGSSCSVSLKSALLLYTATLIPILLFFHLLVQHAAGWSWHQGEQVLCEGGGRDAGVYADHHVLDVLPLHPSICPCLTSSLLWTHSKSEQHGSLKTSQRVWFWRSGPDWLTSPNTLTNLK